MLDHSDLIAADADLTGDPAELHRCHSSVLRRVKMSCPRGLQGINVLSAKRLLKESDNMT